MSEDVEAAEGRDRRKFARVGVRCAVVVGGLDTPLRGVIENISVGGVQILLREGAQVSEGQEVEVEFALSREVERVTMVAIVRRVEAPRLGLEFRQRLPAAVGGRLRRLMSDEAASNEAGSDEAA